MTSSQTRGDILINRIMTEGDDDRTSNELLSEFFEGYPPEKLIPLLRSDDEDTVKIGAFIAQELGAQVRPLMPELIPLLNHPSKVVRYDTLNAILLAGTGDDGEAIARAISLVDDPELAVRKNALDFLARADREQLAAALPHLTGGEFVSGLDWLIEIDNSSANEASDVEIESRLASEDRLVRWFAGVAAARAYRRNPDLLDRMADGRDEELKAFAESQQKRFRLEPRRFREQH
jgi:hypothetical protein